MKKVLVCGYIGFNNFGDEAIFKALNLHLSALGFDVSVLKKDKNIIKNILNCDILFSGGGSLLQNKTSNLSLLYYLFVIFIAKFFNKKVIIFAQGFEKIKGAFFEKLTALIIRQADIITVRDKQSKNYLSTLGLEDVVLLNDPIYDLIKDIKPKENKQGLVIQLRDYKGFNKNILNNLADCIKKFYNNEVTVLSLQNSFDKDICLEFIEILKQKGVAARFVSFKDDIFETIEILNSAKFVISTRLHGLFAAHALESKTFALIYDDKIKTFVEQYHTPSIDLCDYDSEILSRKIDEFLNSNINEAHPPHQHKVFEWEKIDSILK